MSLLDTTVARITPQDASWRATARERLEQLTMPYWALGRLMDLAEDLAGITRSMQPPVTRRVIVTMASDHGVLLVESVPPGSDGKWCTTAGSAGINARRVGRGAW